RIGQLTELEPYMAKTSVELGVNIVKLAALGGGVRGDEVIIAPANIFVKTDVRSAAQAAPLRILMKNSADEERIITDVRAQQKRFVLCGARKRDQHIGEILAWRFVGLCLRAVQKMRAGKILKKGTDIIAQFAIADPGVAQNVSREDIEVELGG